MPTAQARYWIATIPTADWSPALSGPICYLKGQREVGTTSSYEHYQVLVVCDRRVTLRQLKSHLCNTAHVEPTRSNAANDYVWKEDTRVPGTQFELGELPISRARATDWSRILDAAKKSDMDSIPADILIRNYSALRRIGVDYSQPVTRPGINVKVFWGPSGTGKTHRAWQEAGPDAYIKNPNTKWWDGYRGQANVIIDEFTGRIDLSYLLTWLDKYPCYAEIKGYTLPLKATNFWITSNIEPQFWYTDITSYQRSALLRRLHVVESMEEPFNPNHLTPLNSEFDPNLPNVAAPHPNTPNPLRIVNLDFLLDD